MSQSRKSRWAYKSCPRCRGDVYIEHETTGPTPGSSAHCLQCGFERQLTRRPAISAGSGVERAEAWQAAFLPVRPAPGQAARPSAGTVIPAGRSGSRCL